MKIRTFALVILTTLILASCVSSRKDPLPRTWEESGLVFKEEFAPAKDVGKDEGIHVLSARIKGNSRRPVMMLTHGSSSSTRNDLIFRYTVYDVIRYKWLLKYFADKGYYAFFFAHKGHSRSGGELEHFTCANANFEDVARSVGDDFRSGHKFLATKPLADSGHIVIGGQSTGGVGALDFASRQPEGVVGVLNFSGTFA
jgi:pimeloyl-ACP methyl ester carboxylesterase